MPGLLQILRIKARTKPQCKPIPHHDIVPDARDPTIIDLRLGKATRIETILARNLEPNPLPHLTIPRHLRTSLEHAVHLVKVTRAEHAHIIRRRDRRAVNGRLVANSSLVARDRRLLHIVPGLRTDEEPLATKHDVDVGDGTLEQIDEGARVDVGLLVVQVELGADGLAVRDEGRQQLGLGAVGDLVVELDLGVEGVLGVPADGGGGAWEGVFG